MIFKFENTALCLLFSALLLAGCATQENYDILIKNGQILDGSGRESYVGDIGINADRIVAMGDLSDAVGRREINASGLVVAPGFIDIHTHLDPILELPECESHIRQGVTTALGGPDGSSPWPFGMYLDTLEQIGVGMNVGYLIGHNTVRRNVMGLDNRAPTGQELEQMEAQVSQAMKEGAFGISTGLKYLPGTFSEVNEVIALSKVASVEGGIYTSHLREEGLGLLESVEEAIIISEKADIPVVLTHHKVVGKPMWGKSKKTLAMVDSARAKGLDIRIDQYPYDRSYTSISILIPGWARAGGNDAFRERVSNPRLRDSISAGIIFNLINDRGGADLKRVQFAKVAWMPELEGKTLEYWCDQKGLEPTMENGADLVIEAQLKGGASCVFHAMDEGDVERILKHPQTMIASDGRLVAPGMGHPHPRWYGTFPRVLGRYVREKQVLSLSEAVHKMTALPAAVMGLTDRGLLREGMKADIVLFDPATVTDKATFESPHQYPEGIPLVIVNGQVSFENGEFQHLKAGMVLRKPKP
ncbi:N-acyl-D-amino-acid deacylase family protein [Robiginitalea aurantiaca]|uniref:D-aminoacylase n=1 Tax=Robiginitalea aurantiaca TaxID=3056915 RepID=A0ABT7WDV5_9FLAO|nr:D-aminoacylase [Robiginitalea aurantiaca]MDM9631097.1 D-aminoacylase [Robiginitalea aurantiaca]